MLKARVLTAIALLAAFLVSLFYLPALYWNALVLLAVFAGAKEWAAFARYASPLKWIYVLLTVALTLGLMLAGNDAAIFCFLLAILCWVLLVPLWLGFAWGTTNNFLMAVTGWLVLIPVMLALVQLHAKPWLLLSLMAVVWLADSAAYFAGRRFGRHKLAPAISPGKTWEGVLGGLVAVALYAGVLFGTAVLPHRLFGDGVAGFLLFVAALCLLTGFSVLGDLFESWMKRQAGLKDSGNLLPGHGGLLDRIDALTSTLPLATLVLSMANELVI
jgi:phosphatidate cytidylyltransferase